MAMGRTAGRSVPWGHCRGAYTRFHEEPAGRRPRAFTGLPCREISVSAEDFNPLRLDVAAFAKAGGELSGAWPLAGMERLAACATPDAAPGPQEPLNWQLRGENRLGPPGAAAETWLHLKAQTLLRLECQRCLLPVETPLEIDRALRFVAGEDQAAALDAESEDDVLALSRALDLRELIEEELLLAMPLVARHEVCAAPRAAGAAPEVDAEADEQPHPFAALAALKKPGRAH